MQQLLLYSNQPSKEIYVGFIILVLISSMVVADPKSQLDLPEEFEINVDAVFEREKKLRQPKQDNNEWRKKSERSSREVRWGAKSIYDTNPNQDPFSYNDNNPHSIAKPADVAPQFELRF